MKKISNAREILSTISCFSFYLMCLRGKKQHYVHKENKPLKRCTAKYWKVHKLNYIERAVSLLKYQAKVIYI